MAHRRHLLITVVSEGGSKVTWLSRWRHRRGFGVHSPLAYRFISDTVKEKYAYYNYSKLKTDHQRLLYRTTVFLQPSKIIGVGKVDISPANLACPKIGHRNPPRYIDQQETKLAIVESNKIEEISKLLTEGYCIFFLGRLTPNIFSTLNELGFGMTFDIRRKISIILPFKQLSRQDIKL